MARGNHALVMTLLALAGSAPTLAACGHAASAVSAIETSPATQQDIVVTVEATGVIEPVDAVDVKSKASGQVVKMPIVVGSRVKEGDLVVQVDPRQMQSLYDAAKAAVAAATANLSVNRVALAREDSLLHQGAITAVEHETSVVAFANAQSALASAQSTLETATINLNDATVLAPMDGIVINKNVSVGQVIASATNVVGGGTSLLTVADLRRVLDSALVNESDIGSVKVGQSAAVTVDAFPTRVFHGTVLRISPQAIVQQSVTMFPVLVSLDNPEGLLMPGMSTDATIDITRVPNAVAVPNDAIGSTQEVATLAAVLGIPQPAVDSALAGARTRGPQGVGRGGRGGRAGAPAVSP
ncbi:MAG TPA: efflux RND transporter periplasmic adaptor subunit, partial [Gemmatimonadaceae bacterium]|nr:efflux RND transporter periplasmic adaptor subunit [Gemmatimonadaceae bacterium]